MPDEQPDDPRPDPRPDDVPVPGDVPSEAELARVAIPATVRRAPRYGAFIVAGALVGVLAGLVLALLTADGSGVGDSGGGVLPFLDGQAGVRWILALTLGVVGAFVGGGLAVLADRRSTRRRRSAQG
ncbi:histidine kinase [Cellulomonas sp. S1-8]|uniref:histidine kinase n=1 Tax=Cellulomonas sp. S1-8 TaxID=2904790 RepID=UPI002242CD5F|nr:histidine kinase [Cellulomonas sp. S1-8]UZN02587.1 histidine kinase [Cellulomonas sp. S1-8]